MFENFRSLYLKLKMIFDFVFFPVNFIYEKIEDLGYYLRDKKGWKQTDLFLIAMSPLFLYGSYILLLQGKNYQAIGIFLFLLIFRYVFLRLRGLKSEPLKYLMKINGWCRILESLIVLTLLISNDSNASFHILFVSSLFLSAATGFIWLALNEEPPKRKKYEKKEENTLEILKPMALN